VRDFSIYEEVGTRCADAENMLYILIANLSQGNRIAKEAVDLINSDGGLGYVDYSSLDNEINEISDWSARYTNFKGLCGYYDSDVDGEFFSNHEEAMVELGLLKVEDISVANNLGIQESGVTEEGVEYTKDKAGLTFQDLLTYDGVSDEMKKQFEAYKKRAKESNSQYTDNFDEYIKQNIASGEITYEKEWEKWLSLGIDVIPIVGDAKGLIEAVMGKDLITGRKLSDIERGLSLLSIIPLIGDGGLLLKVGAKDSSKELLKVFGKESLRNASSMGTSILVSDAANEMGLPPWVGLLAYQGTRIGAKGVSKYGGTVSARIKGVENGGLLDTIRQENPSVYKSLMNNIQDSTKDRSVRLSSLGAGELERIYRSNESLRGITQEIDNLGLTAEEARAVRNVLDRGNPETIANFAEVVVKYKGDKDRILGFVDEAAGDTEKIIDSEFREAFNAADNYSLSEETYENHILNRHGSNSMYRNKSHFNSDFNIKEGISSTLIGDNFIVKSNTGDRVGYIFEQTFENSIGVNSKGKLLYTLKVVIDEYGNVITAFPKK
jgi:hypothetical protein